MPLPCAATWHGPPGLKLPAAARAAAPRRRQPATWRMVSHGWGRGPAPVRPWTDPILQTLWPRDPRANWVCRPPRATPGWPRLTCRVRGRSLFLPTTVVLVKGLTEGVSEGQMHFKCTSASVALAPLMVAPALSGMLSSLVRASACNSLKVAGKDQIRLAAVRRVEVKLYQGPCRAKTEVKLRGNNDSGRPQDAAISGAADKSCHYQQLNYDSATRLLSCTEPHAEPLLSSNILRQRNAPKR